jgi:hypothetical protein
MVPSFFPSLDPAIFHPSFSGKDRGRLVSGLIKVVIEKEEEEEVVNRTRNWPFFLRRSLCLLFPSPTVLII